MGKRKADVVGVVLAAGASKRMRGRDKITSTVDGKPVIWYALNLFETVGVVDAVVVVASPSLIPEVEKLLSREGWKKTQRVLAGGPARRDSAVIGVEAAAELAGPGALVLVHDAARPLAEPPLVYALLDALSSADAAVPVVPLPDTIKRVNEEGAIVATLRREELRAAQTPQAFRLSSLLKAYREVSGSDAPTDDASVVEMAGGHVVAVAGDQDNFKITYPEDIPRAEGVLARRRAIGT